MREQTPSLGCFRHLEQRSGRDAGTPGELRKLLEEARELLVHCVHLMLDGAEGIIGWHGGGDGQDREEEGLTVAFAAHALYTPLKPSL